MCHPGSSDPPPWSRDPGGGLLGAAPARSSLPAAAGTGFSVPGERRAALCAEASADCGQALGTHRPRPPGFTAHPQRPGGPCAARQPNLASYIQS